MPLKPLAPFLAVAALGLAAGALAYHAGGDSLIVPFALAAIAFIAALLLGRPQRKDAAYGAAQMAQRSQSAAISPVAQDVIERLPDPLMLLDSAGRVLVANRAMRVALGADASRKHVSAVLRTPSILEAIERTARTGNPETVEFSFPVPVLRQYQAYITRTEGDPAVTSLLLHDLTAIKRAEQARADFVANASHELRTPLAAVAGFIDTLKGHARDDAAAREKFLDIMSVEAERMRRLIDDLLSLTRIEQNEHVLPSGRVEVAGVVRNAVAALSPLAEADKISVTVEAPSDLSEVTGARDELTQLFQNLIQNAIKYGKPGGHVRISIAQQPDKAASARRAGAQVISVAVADDGEGIPREAIPRLTERFYRVDVKRSRERGGTGLGLAIVKHIVNRHQGRLSIESQPGAGSTFTVFLPVANEASPSLSHN